MSNDERGFVPHDVKLDPTGFDISVSTVLTLAGAERFVDIFRKHNIGQFTLTELSEIDLETLGVDDPLIRTKIIDGVKSLPLYDEHASGEEACLLNEVEVTDILEESSQHLHRIYVSLVTNTTALKKKSKIIDSVLYQDKYASDIAVNTLDEISNILNSMETTLQAQIRIMSKDSDKQRTKKLIVGAVGSAVITILGIMFVKSIKQLK